MPISYFRAVNNKPALPLAGVSFSDPSALSWLPPKRLSLLTSELAAAAPPRKIPTAAASASASAPLAVVGGKEWLWRRLRLVHIFGIVVVVEVRQRTVVVVAVRPVVVAQAPHVAAPHGTHLVGRR